MTASGNAGRSVLVTGGADGIGLAIARQFAKSGDRVHICDVRDDALSRALSDHAGLSGTVANVREPADVGRLHADAVAANGTVEVLVNNVGIGGPRAAIEDITVEDWAECFRINVAGALYCMQAVIPGMKAAKTGAVVNVSTASTRTRLPMRTPYVASKFALEGLTLNAARELGPWRIRCNAILPGLMNNARMDGIIAREAREQDRDPAAIEADFLRFVSLRSRTEPDDVARTAVFLASAAADRITGELVSVSGNLEWES